MTLADRDFRGEVGDLMDIADANALAEGDFAGVGLLFRAEDGEESGFARAVRADEADAVAIVNGEGDVLEERSGAEAFGDILRNQDRRHILSLRGRALAPAPWEVSLLGH